MGTLITDMICFIPAHLNSKRLPLKALLYHHSGGVEPLVITTYKRAKEFFEHVYIVTDSLLIADECLRHDDANCIMTGECQTGTERCIEAWDIMRDVPLADRLAKVTHIVNWQVDYPDAEYTEPQDIDCISSLCYKVVAQHQDVHDRNCVKVVTDINNYAQYFSRYAVSNQIHIGIYTFPVSKLQYVSEAIEFESRYNGFILREDLEQLVWQFFGFKIHMQDTKPCISINTKQDYEDFCNVHQN